MIELAQVADWGIFYAPAGWGLLELFGVWAPVLIFAAGIWLRGQPYAQQTAKWLFGYYVLVAVLFIFGCADRLLFPGFYLALLVGPMAFVGSLAKEA